MKALCVDDEILLLDSLKWAVGRSPDIEEVTGFDDELDALEWAESHRCDIAFLDIRMHSMDGLELAQRLRERIPGLHVVFCTGYKEYAVDAFRLHVSGYLMKPVRPEAIQREIDYIKETNPGSLGKTELLTVRCFGSFEIYAMGEPVRFQRTKTKELMAYLIDRRGAIIRSRELCGVLWEDNGDEEKNMDYLHHLFSDLRKSLRDVEAESVLHTWPQGLSVDTEKLECDYYRFLGGDPDARRQFLGEYMNQYEWARRTCESLKAKI